MFREIYYFLRNNGENLLPCAILDVSEKYKIKKYVYYMIYYANKVVHNDFLEAYVGALYSPEGEALLDKYGLSDQTRKTWKCSFEDLVECQDLSVLIAEDLTEEDKKKIEMDSSVFGSLP